MMITHLVVLFSTIQMYEFPYIHFHLIASTGVSLIHKIMTSSQLAWYSVAQLVEHCTGIAEVMGSHPVSAWIFFSGFLFARKKHMTVWFSFTLSMNQMYNILGCPIEYCTAIYIFAIFFCHRSRPWLGTKNSIIAMLLELRKKKVKELVCFNFLKKMQDTWCITMYTEKVSKINISKYNKTWHRETLHAF